jgi:hypothetical protein
MDTVTVSGGTLTIESGTTVCFAAGAGLLVEDSAAVEARGTSSAPVLLTAMDPDRPWGGIQGLRRGYGGGASSTVGQVSLLHTRLEYAEIGVAVHSFIVDSTVVRQIRGPAIRSYTRVVQSGGYFVEGSGRITGSVVDTACTTCGSRDPWMREAAIAVQTSRLVIENTVIRGSGSDGIRAAGGKLSLRDVVIHGSAETGLVMTRAYNPRQGDPAASFEPPISVRITASGSYPADILTALLPDLLPDAAALDRLRGNANDALMLRGGTGRGRDLVIRAGLPTFLAADPSSFSQGTAHISGQLHMEPGASLTILSPFTTFGGRITAEGTADRPIILSARRIEFAGEPAAPSRIVHARLDSITLHARQSHALVIEEAVGRASGLILESPGSKVLRSRFDRGAIVVRAPDVLLSDVAVRGGRSHGFLIEAPNARLSRCEAVSNQGDGIRLTQAAGVHITGCNLFDNAGFGVNNTAPDVLDARGNWWGAPSGPTVSGADEVSGNVDYEPYRDRPAEMTNPTTRIDVREPTSLLLPPLDAPVAAGDTARLTAVARNAAGEWPFAEPLEWRSSNRGVAVVDGLGLVTGVTAGTATITVMARADTALHASATVRVNPGAPSYVWTPLNLTADAIWGSPEAGLFALSANGVLYYDGTRWTRMEGVPNVRLRGIWGTSASNVWIVGDQRTVMRYDGAAWRSVEPPPSTYVRDVWVAAPDQVFVLTADSGQAQTKVWHHDGASWRQLHSGSLGGLWGRSPTDIFVGSWPRSVHHFDGTS